jgi:hypothetical protein
MKTEKILLKLGLKKFYIISGILSKASILKLNKNKKK